MLMNGATADASQVMANFNCAALTQGSTIDSATLTGTTSLPGTGTVTSAGRIGVGTLSPATPLDVNSQILSETGGFRIEGVSNSLRLAGGDTTGSGGAQIGFAGDQDGFGDGAHPGFELQSFG